MVPLVERYANKRVSFRFSGISLETDLSQGLFSSFDIDAGTKFLLKAIAQRVDLQKIRRIADVGCGTGVLGIALAKRIAGCICVFQDRDALALAFARSNCRLNGVEQRCEFIGGLGLSLVGEAPFDLIVSNLPAKAGPPVLTEIIRQMLARLAGGGVAAVVIVAPLAEKIRETLHHFAAEIVHSENRHEHRVYLFRRGSDVSLSAAEEAEFGQHPAGAPAFLEPYIRNHARFSHGRTAYELDTVYNLPDFDSLGRETILALDLIDKHLKAGFFEPGIREPGERRVLIWNPGQGHAAVYLSSCFPGLTPDNFIIASRDALSLEIARWNLTGPAGGEPTHAPEILHLPSMDALCETGAAGSCVADAGSVRLAVIFPHPVTGTKWQDEAAMLAEHVLTAGGTLIASGGSTDMHRLLTALHGMVLHGSRKYHGSRAVVLNRH